jgi:septal ring factor EnvC (AmiA/AmiB activator)
MCHSLDMQRKRSLEAQVSALDAKMSEQEAARKVAEDSQAGLQAQVDELVARAKALTGEENRQKAM